MGSLYSVVCGLPPPGISPSFLLRFCEVPLLVYNIPLRNCEVKGFLKVFLIFFSNPQNQYPCGFQGFSLKFIKKSSKSFFNVIMKNGVMK